MPRPALNTEERTAAREHIREAALAVYMSQGLDAVTIRAVAAQAGIAPAAIYSYFSNRRALVEALWLEPVVRLLTRMEKNAQDIADPIKRIRATLTIYIEFALAKPEIYTGALMHVRPVTDAKPAASVLEGLPLFRILRDALAQAQQQGTLSVNNPALAAQLLWAGVHGALALPVNMDGWQLANQNVLAPAMVDLVLAGLQVVNAHPQQT